MKVGPWVTPPKYPRLAEDIAEDRGEEIRYPDPSDGRTYESGPSEGEPCWVVIVGSCCGAPMKEPESLHFTWNLSKRYTDGKSISGNEKTRQAAKQKAEEAMIALGWTV